MLESAHAMLESAQRKIDDLAGPFIRVTDRGDQGEFVDDRRKREDGPYYEHTRHRLPRDDPLVRESGIVAMSWVNSTRPTS